MRILFVSSCYLPTVNGVSYHIQLLKKALEKRGHTVFLLAPKFPGYKDLEKNIFRYPSLPNPLFPNFPIGIPIYSLSEIASLKPDVVHTHHPFIASNLAVQISEYLNIPLFWTNHTRYEEYFNNYLPSLSGLSHKALSILLRDLASKCQKVICPSRVAVEILKDYKIQNTVIVPTGIDTSFFKPNFKLRPQEYKSLLYLGRIEKEKNTSFLLEIARHLIKITENFKLIIAGDGKEIYTLQTAIHKNKLANHVFLPGVITRDKIAKIYQASHLFISPSLTEVMPATYLEALASGMPIVVLKNSGTEKYFFKNNSIFILPQKPQLIAKKITEICTSQHFDTLCKEARLLGQQFDISNTAKMTEKIYESK